MSGTKLLALVLGFWVIMRAVNKDASGRTLIDHILGRQTSLTPYLGTPLPPGTQSVAVANGYTGNPFPGATGSRLDQGLDLTGKNFLAPFSGKVLYSAQSDPGWQGGGYLAIQNATNPKQVLYVAEGIAPSVFTGDTVQAGERIGLPVSNPYNNIVGNIETGWADPNNPRRPLAQATPNPRASVLGFYQWLRSLGGPVATSTSGAGYR